MILKKLNSTTDSISFKISQIIDLKVFVNNVFSANMATSKELKTNKFLNLFYKCHICT